MMGGWLACAHAMVARIKRARQDHSLPYAVEGMF